MASNNNGTTHGPDPHGAGPPGGATAAASAGSPQGLPPGASGTEILVLVWLMTAVAAAFLGLRVFVKISPAREGASRKGLWWDDHLLLGSWALLVLFGAATTLCVQVGLGSHVGSALVQAHHSVGLQLGVVIATTFSVLGAAASKTSFALTLLRITREGEHRFVYWGIWCVVVTMNLVLAFNVVLQFIWCYPAARAWNPDVRGQCWDRVVVVKYTEFAAYYSAAMDFTLALVPWKVIVGLRMRPKEKIGVLVCMSLGIFAGATSIMRALTVRTLYADDYSYEAGQLFIWTGAELATTIVAASIPILRALLRDIVHSRYRYPGGGVVTELNTFKDMRDGDGILVTRTTQITRSLSTAERGLASREDKDSLLSPTTPMPMTPMSPGPTYHSYVQKL